MNYSIETWLAEKCITPSDYIKALKLHLDDKKLGNYKLSDDTTIDLNNNIFYFSLLIRKKYFFLFWFSLLFKKIGLKFIYNLIKKRNFKFEEAKDILGQAVNEVSPYLLPTILVKYKIV